ncbi:MAG: hypothetical protein ACRDXD_15515 [Acidimicrobiia bacterium]
MSTLLRWALASIVMLAPAVSVWAAEPPSLLAQQTTTTQAETTTVPAGPAPQPAVTTIPEEPESPENAWTYRYLVPTAVLLGVVTAIGIIIAYFFKVTRSRYRVVE